WCERRGFAMLAGARGDPQQRRKEKEPMKERLQRFGGWLAGMVIPNIGAFIAWGLITALFIPTGWLAKTSLDWDWEAITGNIVGPTIKYLLPILIAYTGGKMVHGHRGGVLGAVTAMGVIGGAAFELASGATGDPPQFLGAKIGRAHVCTPVKCKARMTTSA